MKASDWIRYFRRDLAIDKYFAECLREIELQEKHLAEYRRISHAMARDIAKANPRPDSPRFDHHAIIKEYEDKTEKVFGPVFAVGMRERLRPSDEALIAELKALYPADWYAGVGGIYEKSTGTDQRIFSVDFHPAPDSLDLTLQFEKAIAALFNTVKIERGTNDTTKA